MNYREKIILDIFIRESDNLQGAKTVLKELRKTLFELGKGNKNES